ncbi:uncharacterized protein LOC131957190 [Physella acuta]|uniref:uncharacterized protein LOC131957190 n=1 Tax=Physella acuta TaxID=109671 RepID=UPI0027DD6BC7|nr:uncharacterized protein LOC131957190 [Physella acuta]
MKTPINKYWAIIYTQFMVYLANCVMPPHSPPYIPHPIKAVPLPKLPEQYSVKVEANILQKHRTTEVEEHYDSVNKRASVSQTFNGSTTIFIFDYNIGEMYTIYPNGSCKATEAHYDVYSFTKLGKNPQPIMATINDVFRFGQGYEQVYQGKDNIRGIPVDHWTSCQEVHEWGAKYQLDYYFSDPDYTTAGGAEQVPVRAVVNGTANNITPARGIQAFQHIYEFTSFRSGPALDEDVFTIPRGVLCKGKQKTKDIPLIPKRLEVDVEVVMPGIKDQWTKTERLRYDLYHLLAETTYTRIVPQQFGHKYWENAKWEKPAVVSYTVIDDMLNMVSYKINNFYMTCRIKPLDFTPSMESHRLKIFDFAFDNTNFVYQGRDTVRGIPVDVWSGEVGGIAQEIYFRTNSTPHLLKNKKVDIFFQYPNMVGFSLRNKTAVKYNSMHEMFLEIMRNPEKMYPDTDDDQTSATKPIPTRTSDQVAWGDKMSQMFHQRITEKMVHLFRPSPIFTEMGYFDISGCYNDSQVTRIMLSVNASFEHDVSLNYVLFSNSIREALSDKSGLSILQINDVHPYPSKLNKNVTRLIITLLGPVPMYGETNESLNSAIEKLKKTVQSEISLVVNYAQYSKTFTIDPNAIEVGLNMSLLFRQQGMNNSDSYSAGSVTAIAFATLIIGVALCSAVLFFIYKRKHPEESLIPYRITE